MLTLCSVWGLRAISLLMRSRIVPAAPNSPRNRIETASVAPSAMLASTAIALGRSSGRARRSCYFGAAFSARRPSSSAGR